MPKHGIDASIYLNTGTHGAAVWVEADLFGDVTPAGGWDKADIVTRRSRVKMGAKVMLDLGFTGKMLCEDDDTTYVAFRDAWQSLTATVDLLVLDGPIDVAGSFGWRADYQITAGAQDQPTNDVLYRNFEAVVYPTENPPVWVTTTGAGAFDETAI